MTSELIYHMCRQDEWDAAQAAGSYGGSSQDVADGFIHFSSANQIRASAAKHRVGQDDLILLAVDPDHLGDNLKWEASRGGQLFPHLYGDLSVDDVQSAVPLLLNADGVHIFPEDFPDGD